MLSYCEVAILPDAGAGGVFRRHRRFAPALWCLRFLRHAIFRWPSASAQRTNPNRRQSARFWSSQEGDGIATGRLHAQAFPDGVPGSQPFEELLGAMARNGLVEIADTSFEKDGKRIDFRKVRITRDGGTLYATNGVMVPVPVEMDARPRKRTKTGKKAKAKKLAPKAVQASPPSRAVQPPKAAQPARIVQPGNADALMTVLKAWRLAEAKKLRIPAFRILTDKALQAIAQTQPRNAPELMEVPGVGLKLAEKYGEQIFRIVGSVR